MSERVRGAMATIAIELEGNAGVYPHNGGALSSAEVARRAGVHPTTFYSPKQRELGVEVKQWLEGIKARNVVERGSARRDLAKRIADWKCLYDGLAQSHRCVELEFQQAQAELAQVRGELKTAKRENGRLTQLLRSVGGNKIVSMLSRKN